MPSESPRRIHVASVVLGILFSVGLSSAAFGEVVTFQQGTDAYTGTEDIMLIQWAANDNFGGRADMDVGINGSSKAHTLIRFDLSSLAGQIDTVTGVTLRLWENPGQGYSPAGNGTVEVYRLADANAGWVEGTHSGAGGEPDEGLSTYNNRLDGDTSGSPTAWAGSAGAGTAGTDYVDVLLGSLAYTTSTSGQFDLVLSGDLSFIKDWADGGTNAGFFLKDAVEAPSTNRINFRSSESGLVAERPMLIVEFVPEPSTLTLLAGLGLAGLLAHRRRRS